MKIRKLHRWIALAFSPFLLVIAFTGTILILSDSRLVSFPVNFEKWVYKIHTWEIIGTTIGVIFPLVLLVIIITGIMIFIETELRKRKAKHKKPDEC